MMLVSNATFYGTTVAFGLAIYALLRMSEFLYVLISRRGKARVVWIDDDAGDIQVSFHEKQGNEIHIGKGDNKRIVLLDGQARYGGQFTTWLINRRHGHNYRAPNDAETVGSDPLLQVLSISNPAMLHKVIAVNKARQALTANDKDDAWGWVVPVAMVALVGIVLTVGLVGFIAYRLVNGGSA